jgi:hypothetical protein
VILPRVVHEREAGVDGLVDDPDRFSLGCNVPDVIAAQAERGDPFARAAEEAARDRFWRK